MADALRQIVAERRQMQGEQMTLEDERRAKFAAESMLAVMDGVQLQWLMDEEDAPELVEPIEFALTAMLAAMLNPPGDLLGEASS
ncbi:hypothetical protein [Bifidobacterium sp. UTCIF-24]|uniref:hypothetical protein n=1 Tax=Bifidobacterium sp. UTCIF-24 TaxID=1465256 RepID=UPI0015E454E8|nr:hypothetical protein [Bifidobacterium sp. UTCIF-24]